MVGRAAQGNPWLLKEIGHYLLTGKSLGKPSITEVYNTVAEQLTDIYGLYGEYMGVRIARKHLGWYVNGMREGKTFRKRFNQLTEASQQLASVREFFEHSIEGEVMAA